MDLSQLGEAAAKIGLTAVLAGSVGAEREWTGKWAGLRTHMLIGVGATLLTHISHLGTGAPESDRIAAQIVSGIGFIGGGTILQSRGAVHGLTTAAGLWVSAAVGIAVGGGYYLEATLATVTLLLILAALRPLEDRLLRGHLQTVVLQLTSQQRLAGVVEILDKAQIETHTVSVAHAGNEPKVTICFRGSDDDGQRLVDLAGLEGYSAVHETVPAHAPSRPAKR